MLGRRDFFAAAVAAMITAISAKVYGVRIPEDETSDDEPTFIKKSGLKEWYNKEGEPHRDGDKPARKLQQVYHHLYAVCHSDTTLEHHLHVLQQVYHHLCESVHSEAIVEFHLSIQANGNKLWCQDDRIHRDGDKPAIMYAKGYRVWCKHGQRIRSNQC